VSNVLIEGVVNGTWFPYEDQFDKRSIVNRRDGLGTHLNYNYKLISSLYVCMAIKHIIVLFV
jgi:uncharacterized membrane protein